MPTRKVFLRCALFVAGACGILGRAAGAAPVSPAVPPTSPPTSAPRAAASPAAKPSDVARRLAAWLQRRLSKARLSDTMVEKIAEDIDANLVIARDMSASHRDALPPPDFVFAASVRRRP